MPRWITALILIGPEAGVLRMLDAFEHVGHAAEAAIHLREDVLVEAVEADRHAREARGLEFVGMLGQQHAIGGHGDVVDAVDAVEIGDEVGQVHAQQRLAAGDAQLAARPSARTGASGAGSPRTTAARPSSGSA